jgi:hypothetical protein
MAKARSARSLSARSTFRNTPVSTEQLAAFARATGYRTEAERFGWSFVFRNHLALPHNGVTMPGAP